MVIKKFLLLGITALLGGLALTACSNSDEEEVTDDTTPVINMLPKSRSVTLTNEQRQYVEKNNDFAFNLYRAIRQSGNKSTIVSPISVTYLMGMLNDGALGQTTKEITTMLGFGEGDKTAVNEYCKTLIEQVPLIDESVILKIANIMAVNKNVELEPDYQKDMKQYYEAETASIDFSSPASLDYLNNWSKEHTEGLIPQIIESLDPSSLLVLMNAIYFQATWPEKFDPKDTRQENFTKADGSELKLQMMHRTARCAFAMNDVFSTLCLPYGNGDKWSMMVLLPNEGKTTDDIIKNLSNSSWNENWANRQSVEVDIKIPRFSTRSDITLNDAINSLGAPSIFRPHDADFSLITKNCKESFAVSLIKQKAAIEVTEEGTKASAVTIADANGSSGYNFEKVNFHANHPFVYLIREHSTGIVFFVGTYMGD